MRFKKIYVEITNACNFNCSFCFKSLRKKSIVSEKDFSSILSCIRPYTNYIYLHVLGEPMLHPRMASLLEVAHRQGFCINITTNGSLLSRWRHVSQMEYVRQFNISLHDAQENISAEHLPAYLADVIAFAKELSRTSYISFRLWNTGACDAGPFNLFCMSTLNKAFGTSFSMDDFGYKNVKLSENVFLHNGARFLWPGCSVCSAEKTCYALKDHIAILSDGRVVPCCLDADGQLALGNIFETPLADILNSHRAQNILEGFRRHVAVEDLCKHCGFILDK